MIRASDTRANGGGGGLDRARASQRGRWRSAVGRAGLAIALFTGCGDKTPPPPPPCEQKCQDGVALRAVREMMKFAFNMTLQGEPVGIHDKTTDKFARGTARVHGWAYANASQGVTDVNLYYVFSQAVYVKKEDDAEENYVMAIDGTISQWGKIAVQPSAPTALNMSSEALILAGTVYDPPINYPENLDAGLQICKLSMLQNGNSVSGSLCDRTAGFSF